MAAVHVVAAVIRDGAGRVLLSRRADTAHQGGLWEFPGGKVEPGEARRAALERELREELAIAVVDAEALLQVNHDYGDLRVHLDVWYVTGFEGEPRGVEGQPLAWVATADLRDYAFPAANRAIVEALCKAPREGRAG